MKRCSLSRLAYGFAGLTALLALGCQKPLLSPDDERSPYARYDAVRNQSAPQYITDEYGRRRPNLRDRLLPRD
jgi:hypothetical protein